MEHFDVIVVGFFDDNDPLGLIGAFALTRLLHPTVVMGGAKTLANGLFRAGAKAGVQYRAVADACVIEISGGELRVICQDGREFTAKAVVSTLDPKTTFLELLDSRTVSENIRQAATDWRLYLGGGGVHPGIPGSLAGGYNAARAICTDRGFPIWWPEPAVVQRLRRQVEVPSRS